MFIQDGFRTIITIDGFPNIMLREREVQPCDIDGGNMIDTHTMRNVLTKTKVPQYLLDFGDITVQANYDPFVYATIIQSIINSVLKYTVTFPDKATLIVWAAMHKFTPASLRNGEFPLAEIKIGPVNRTEAGVEVVPAMSAPIVGRGGLAWPPEERGF